MRKTGALRTLAARFKYLRQAADLTQAALAEAAGVERPYVSQLESGGRTNPRAREFCRLVAVFGVDALWLLEGRGERPAEADVREAVARAQQTQAAVPEGPAAA
ncbi:MAG TPA: helix-turn-helix transcriptional regulator [Polyangiaceae bacterium]|nr:helix-turn-helix transcriptional regulator [Polyangiaceae bacterium]